MGTGELNDPMRERESSRPRSAKTCVWGTYCAITALVLLASGCAAGGDTPPASPGPKLILLVGDGMGRGQLAAASLFKTGKVGELHMHSLPVHGTITTSSLSGMTDSAAGATVMATGHLTYNGWVGIDSEGAPVQTLVELAQAHGMATGLVSTAKLSHATPASFAAHVDSRNQYAEIATQIVALGPDVLLGGGRGDFVDGNEGRVLSEELVKMGYRVVGTGAELAGLNGEGQRLAGFFADEHLPYVIDPPAPSADVPSLQTMTLEALERLDRDSDGFFLLVEGGRIDHAGHRNELARCIGETIAFDDTVKAVMDWAKDRAEVTIIVTSDHETGGLKVNGESAAGDLPEVSWRWGVHTNATIEMFAQGPGTEVFVDALRDHRWVHHVFADQIVPSQLPKPILLTDGILADTASMAGATALDVRSNLADPATRLTRLSMAVDERGLSIGLEGLFRWDTGAVVAMIDVDYGANTGVRTVQSLADTEGRADKFLSEMQWPISPDSQFAADMAFVSLHGAQIKVEQQLDGAGLRSWGAFGGTMQEFAVLPSVSNYSERVRSYGLAQTYSTDQGLEIFVEWDDLYEGGTTPGANPCIAVWAMQMNEDGTPSKQSVPGFGRARPPAPIRIGKRTGADCP